MQINLSTPTESGITGVVVWKEPHALDDEAVVVLRLRDWQDWHGNEPKQLKEAIQTKRPATKPSVSE